MFLYGLKGTYTIWYVLHSWDKWPLLRLLTNGGKLLSEIKLMIYLLGITTVVDIAVSLFYCTHNNALLLQYCIWVKFASKNLLLFYLSCQWNTAVLTDLLCLLIIIYLLGLMERVHTSRTLVEGGDMITMD